MGETVQFKGKEGIFRVRQWIKASVDQDHVVLTT